MRYSIGTNLADFGFGFLEKIHEPIFLVHRLGKITKMNEAGRKLLRIAKVNLRELDSFVSSNTLELFRSSQEGYRRLKLGSSDLHIIARSLRDSDYILVEVKR
ncbi:MAG: hypothetical protein HC883_06010 [Bdellovibrionaceae bacterium]|nr:hypothetical protein [Pseudobdellovibrionaceae bacterium]